MINGISVVGWLINFGIKVSLAVPFWICWDFFEVGKNFFYFVPVRFQLIGFWNTVGIFIVFSIIGSFHHLVLSLNNSDQ